MSTILKINQNIPVSEATPTAIEAADTNHINSNEDATLAPSRSLSIHGDHYAKHGKALSDATSIHSESREIHLIPVSIRD
jgi:hypothetical protein